MKQQIQQISVKALFKRDDTVLLVKDPKGVWELPGGRIDFGETPQEALKRELAEELGWYDVTIGKPIDTFSFTVSKDGTNYQFIVIVFTCSSQEDKIVPHEDYGHEHTETRWVPVDEVAGLDMREGYKNMIESLAS